ncbi:MAG: 1-acyl-sn-glycerol-3-phosphate acyltransferase [Acidimicrobiia bacterium]|nr:1-acyl-sn-glycerol-3-phosphate acyltransferase [Acidimicrobiia bacterium]
MSIETIERDRADDRAAANRTYGRHQRLAKRLLNPVFRLLFRIEVNGVEHVPTTGPAVLCPNHLAAIDSFLLPSVLDRPVLYVGKAEYLDDWRTRWLFPALGMIPIDRRGGEHSKGALDVARSVLEGGGLFAIYPEGTRSRSGKLYRGHTGAARLAIETGAPIVPVGLLGTAEVQPVDAVVPRPFKPMTVTFGPPIPVERYRSRIGDHTVYRELIDEVMFEIQRLTGQEYVPRYAQDDQRPTAPPTEIDSTPTLPRRSSTEVLVSRPLVSTG